MAVPAPDRADASRAVLRVLTIGGIDPGGGAGLSADARMVQARGGLAMPVTTALTVQNRHGCTAVHEVELPILEASLEAALADGPVHGVKTGLFGSAAQLRWCSGRLSRIVTEVPLVVDPVLSATAGGWAGSEDLVAAYRDELLPLATLATPNLPELERLAPGAGAAGLLATGCRAVLVKGGHGKGSTIEDVLSTSREQMRFPHPRLDVGEVHGTGCALAAALAVYLAAGRSVVEACERGIADLQRCLAETSSEGGPPRPLRIV